MIYRYRHIGYGPGRPGREITRSTPLVPVPPGWSLVLAEDLQPGAPELVTIEGVAERVSGATLDELRSLRGQIDRLGTFLIERWPSEFAPAGAAAVDVAIGLLGQLAPEVAALDETPPPAPPATGLEPSEPALPGAPAYLTPPPLPPALATTEPAAPAAGTKPRASKKVTPPAAE